MFQLLETRDDDAGFSAIFEGSTLENWDGDPNYWCVENVAILGETTEHNVLPENTFIILARRKAGRPSS